MRNDLREACPSRRAVLSSLKEMNCVRYHQEEAKKQAKTYCDCREDWWKFVCGRGVGLRFQIFEADLETSRFDECLAKQTNFKPPWMRSFLIPDVRNKWCSIPYPSGDYLEAVPSSLRKWMNPDCNQDSFTFEDYSEQLRDNPHLGKELSIIYFEHQESEKTSSKEVWSLFV